MAGREVNDATAELIRSLHNSHLEFKADPKDINGIGFDLTGFTAVMGKAGDVSGIIWHCAVPLIAADTPTMDGGSYWHDQFGEYRFNLLFIKCPTAGDSATLSNPRIGPYTFPDQLNVATPCFIDYTQPMPMLGAKSAEVKYLLRSANGPEVYGIAETKIHVEDDGRCKYVSEFIIRPPDYYAEKDRRRRETRSEHEDPRWGGY